MEDFMTPEEATAKLFQAVKDGNIGTARAALAAGADPTANDNDQWQQTPLHLAVERGHTDLGQLLIDKGADPDARDDWQETPLHLAARGGRTDLVRLLIDKGADSHVRNNQQHTPLHLATGNGKATLVTMLQDAGRDQAGHAGRVAKRRGTEEPQVGG
jgi:ankyrin repeat protein